MKNLIGCCLVLCSAVAMAGGTLSVPITIEGTVLAAVPCAINNGLSMAVNFGNMNIINTDWSSSQQQILYTLNCTAAGTQSTTLRMEMVPSVAFTSNANFLGTSNSNVGIVITFNGTQWPANTWQNFSASTLPVLYAYPIRATGSTPALGTFTATASLVITYQ